MAVRNPLDAAVAGDPLSTSCPGISREAAAEAAAAILGHHFARPALLQEALTHRSAAPTVRGGRGKGAGSNERLEFVGDRVLGFTAHPALLAGPPRSAPAADCKVVGRAETGGKPEAAAN